MKDMYNHKMCRYETDISDIWIDVLDIITSN